MYKTLSLAWDKFASLFQFKKSSFSGGHARRLSLHAQLHHNRRRGSSIGQLPEGGLPLPSVSIQISTWTLTLLNHFTYTSGVQVYYIVRMSNSYDVTTNDHFNGHSLGHLSFKWMIMITNLTISQPVAGWLFKYWYLFDWGCCHYLENNES